MRKLFFYIGFIAIILVLSGQGCFSLSSGKPGTSGPAGMFVSTDKGESWKQISIMPKADGVRDISGANVYRLFTDPQDPSALYWASSKHGFFYSYDGGMTWQQPAGDVASGPIYSIAVHPADKCTIYVTDGSKILKTEDCNRSWEEVYLESRDDTRIVSLVFNPLSPYQIYMAEANGDLLQSLDGGTSWQVLHRFGVNIRELFADPLQKDVLYMASKLSGLYRSEDGGRTWVSLRDKMDSYPGSNEYRRFAPHMNGRGVLYWVSTYGILRSEDGGDTWNDIKLITPPGSADIYGFAINPQNDQEIYYTATINNRSTFYKTVDGGQKWITRKMPSGQIPSVLYVHPQKEDVIYLGFTIPPK